MSQSRFTETLASLFGKSKKLEDISHVLLENLPLMVFVKDAKDLKFVRFNKVAEEILGYSREDLLGKSDYDFFSKDLADYFVSQDRAVLAGRVVVDIPEEMVQTKSKGEKILHTKKIPIYGDDGQPQYLLGISEDITEKINSEKEKMLLIHEQAILKEREKSIQREKFLAEASALLASSLDYHGTLNQIAKLAINFLGDWCTITMKHPDGTISRVAAHHKDPERAPLLKAYLSFPISDRILKVLQKGTHLNSHVSEQDRKNLAETEEQYETLMKLGIDSTLIVSIKTRDKIIGALSFVTGPGSQALTEQDITLAEELGRRAGSAIENALLYTSAQVAIKSRDEFLSIASHELKTPITSLKMQLQMMERNVKPQENLTIEPEKLLKSLVNANGQINRLTALIEDLLDATRIETGKLTYIFEKVNLSELVTEVIDRFREQLSNLGCAVIPKIEPMVFAACDRYRMEQVVTNLLTNSMKYGPQNPIIIEVFEVGDKAKIIVTDEGMGIPPDMHRKIFERFERAAVRNNISGLGLGLYITKQIVDAHQGNISVDSSPGMGAKFTVTLHSLK